MYVQASFLINDLALPSY